MGQCSESIDQVKNMALQTQLLIENENSKKSKPALALHKPYPFW